jgi:hypothetical protein
MSDEIKRKINDWGHEETTYDIPSNPDGKIDLGTQVTFFLHRSGWNFAMQALKPIHNTDGCYFHGFLEDIFSWHKKDYQGRGELPFKKPWCGFFHNPHNPPEWFGRKENFPQNMMSAPEFEDSLEHCVGFWALSNYHADFLREQTGKPVSVLTHPSEIPELQFNYENFLENKLKRIVNIGYWLRKVNSIYVLPLKKTEYLKTRLLPFEASSRAGRTVEEFRWLELKHDQEAARRWGKYYTPEYNYVDEFYRIPNDQYDRLLSENIIFLDMHDSSANNAVIESIARATPLLVNPIPAVVEYLGEDYPFYFESLEEAADKAKDYELVKKTHEYLKVCKTRKKLTQEYFLQDFIDSEVYGLL